MRPTQVSPVGRHVGEGPPCRGGFGPRPRFSGDPSANASSQRLLCQLLHYPNRSVARAAPSEVDLGGEAIRLFGSDWAPLSSVIPWGSERGGGGRHAYNRPSTHLLMGIKVWLDSPPPLSVLALVHYE